MRLLPLRSPSVVVVAFLFFVIDFAFLYGPAEGGILPGGVSDDDRISVVYHANTGELAVDLPEKRDLARLDINSEAGVFIGERPDILSLSFDDYNRNLIFVFRQASAIKDSFSFGTIVVPRLSEQFLLEDLTAHASPFTDPEPFGPVDLIYIPVPEPYPIALLLNGAISIVLFRRLRARNRIP